jgi:hypothetical protein
LGANGTRDRRCGNPASVNSADNYDSFTNAGVTTTRSGY